MAKLDSTQLSYWFDLCSDRMVLYARQWLGIAQAEDAVQEAFVRLMAQSKSPKNIQAWLFKTVRNNAIDLWRKQQRHKRHHESIAREQATCFQPSERSLLDTELISLSLQTLPESQREVITLRIWGQLSFKEIANVLGQSITTVHSRYQTALANMKKKLERSCPTNKN